MQLDSDKPEDRIPLEKCGQFRVYFYFGSENAAKLLFEDSQGKLKFSVLLTNSKQELAYLLALLRQADGGDKVVDGKPVGIGRRILLRLLGRSIVFADEFAVWDRSRPSVIGRNYHIAWNRFVFAQLRGWIQPGAVILVTNISGQRKHPEQLSRRNWSADFRKLRLDLEQCRQLAKGIDYLLSNYFV